ncbi:MAG: SPOR domain-containing protein [Pseudomonadota bacterium]|nr:SPOR domain-containing protein [Pseudomonadota bacterium]
MARSYATGISRYQLKHRLLGAAILIGLAILIVPGLLGKPSFLSPEKKPASVIDVDEAGFKSKIEPVFEGALKQAEESAQAREEAEAGKPALAVRDNGDGATDGESGKRTTFKPIVEDRSFLSDTAGTSVEPAAKELAVEKAARQDAPAKKKAAADKKPTPVTEKVAKREPGPKPAAKPAAKSAPKTSAKKTPAKKTLAGGGWVVRVGTFAKQQNAESVTKLLRSKGLAPRQSQVDTKVGKATRIWLGPYPVRDEANRISAGLKEITGEKGYVTRASS